MFTTSSCWNACRDFQGDPHPAHWPMTRPVETMSQAHSNSSFFDSIECLQYLKNRHCRKRIRVP